MDKAKQADEAKNRTCVPKWRGLKYIRAVARHFNNEWITDREAISLLDAGFLKPEDFVKLPDGWGSKEPEAVPDAEPVVKAAAADPTPKAPRKRKK